MSMLFPAVLLNLERIELKKRAEKDMQEVIDETPKDLQEEVFFQEVKKKMSPEDLMMIQPKMEANNNGRAE